MSGEVGHGDVWFGLVRIRQGLVSLVAEPQIVDLEARVRFPHEPLVVWCDVAVSGRVEFGKARK